MKFIHAGDVHLGNPFSGLDQQLPYELKKQIQNATITAFTTMIDQAINSAVDFILLPGDLYNSTQTSPIIQDVVSTQFERLNTAKIAVYLSFGNHDFAADTQPHLPWPDNVHVFNQDVHTYQLSTRDDKLVAITGFSYQTQRQTKGLAGDFPIRDRQVDYHIGMYHGTVGTEGDAYAPFNVSDMLAKRYDYWALGHIHVRQTLNQVPFIGYSGNMQGLNRKETGEKGYYLVEENNQQLVPRFVPVAPILWDTLCIDEMSSEDELIQYLATFPREKMTLLSVIIQANHLPESFKQRLYSHIILDKLRQEELDRIWVVKLIYNPKDVLSFTDNIDQQYWQEAFNEIDHHFRIDDYLSNQVPTDIREFFLDGVGMDSIKIRMKQIIEERRQNHED